MTLPSSVTITEGPTEIVASRGEISVKFLREPYILQEGDIFCIPLEKHDFPRMNPEGKYLVKLIRLNGTGMQVNDYRALTIERKIVCYKHSKSTLYLSDTFFPRGSRLTALFWLLNKNNDRQLIEARNKENQRTPIVFTCVPESHYEKVCATLSPFQGQTTLDVVGAAKQSMERVVTIVSSGERPRVIPPTSPQANNEISRT